MITCTGTSVRILLELSNLSKRENPLFLSHQSTKSSLKYHNQPNAGLSSVTSVYVRRSIKPLLLCIKSDSNPQQFAVHLGSTPNSSAYTFVATVEPHLNCH
jgi:hypothetical protein